MAFTLHSSIVRLVHEDEGQDIVEYALLTATVGLAGLAVFTIMRNNMAEAYANWIDPAVPGSLQYNWEVPPPMPIE